MTESNEAAKTSATFEIPFPVLPDPDLVAHRAFRVVRHVGDAEFARLKGKGLDIKALWNAWPKRDAAR